MPDSPGGSNKEVQFNNAGAFGGISSMTYDGALTSVNDNAFQIVDETDPTKTFVFSLGGSTTGKSATLATTSTNNRTYTLPDATGNVVLHSNTQTLSNKTLDNTNTVALLDSLFEIQDNSDTTKKGHFNTANVSTATTRTLDFPDADGTIVLNNNNATLTNKNIGVTQLRGAANTFAVNNTGSTANYTEQPWNSVATGTYSGTITWTGTTAPSGSTNHQYWFKQIGNLVTLTISLNYATAGSAVTIVQMAFPAGAPAPVAISGTTTNDKVATGTGWIDNSSSGALGASRVYATNDGGGNYSIKIVSGSMNAKVAFATISYSTN